MAMIYKIRRVDGLFSTGGVSPRFTAKGKVWNNLGPLKNHLNILWEDRSWPRPRRKGTVPEVYKNCMVISYEITETPTRLVAMQDFVNGAK